MGKIYRCCYTNAEKNIGGTVSSGWQAVAVSPDIPGDAYNTCVKLQNANSAISADVTDERGNVLNLYEIVGDGNYIYVLRTQYGLTDRLGRPNIFSHGIIFSLKDSNKVIEEPNAFLALKRTSFKESEDSAQGGGATWDRGVWLTLEAAMRQAGIGREQYAVLAKCVYAQMSDTKSSTPLYVQYDGTEEQLRAILYCVYCGIPYHMRKTIKIAASISANDKSKNIVFTENAAARQKYLIPQTGENNVLSHRIEQKIARYGYIDYAEMNLKPGDFKNFFMGLNSIAETLGEPSNELILKLGFYYYNHRDGSPATDKELENNLSDALRLQPSGNGHVEMLLLRMLTEVNTIGLFLTEESESALEKWLANTASEELKKAGGT